MVWIAAVVALMLTVAVGLSAQDVGFQVIVHAENPTGSLERVKVSRMLQKRIVTWEDDVAVVPVDLKDDSDVRAAFSKTVHKKSINSIKNYWKRVIFSGKGVPPPELENDAAVIAFVAENRGAIGYVSGSATLPAGVKVLQVTYD
ncbi:MAG: hypothetical protein AAF772_11630 [Acidobacteriota bacterium]